MSIDNLCSDAAGIIADYHDRYPSTPIFLVGHSLGGSIVTRVAASDTFTASVLGIVLIDIVEETALAALTHMPRVLAGRPSSFRSEEEAIDWALNTRTCRTRDVAEISFLSQYQTQSDGSLTMITDLSSSEPHWDGWFRGLSETFLSLPSGASRLLVLAETDYLDKPLLIGQMQGKFQLEIVRDTGHAIQEDQPKKLAALINTFVDRNLAVFALNNKRT